MKNIDEWSETKFTEIRGELRADRSGRHVSPGSRIFADAMASGYGRALRGYARGRLLDVGCGQVPLYGAYRDFVTQVTCIDWQSSVHSQAHVDEFVDLTGRLPYPSDSFDTVVLSDVIEHIPNPENLMTEIGRVLSPSGHLILGAPFLYWLHEEPHDYGRYTRHQLARFCFVSGLDVVLLEEVGGAPEVLADIIAKSLPRQIAAIFSAIALRALQLGLVSRASARSRRVLPMGHILVARRAAH